MMASATAPSPCRSLARAIDTYLDGELEPSLVIEVETHLSRCGSCRERVVLQRSVRQSVRKSCGMKASDAFRARIQAAMAQERKGAPQTSPQPSSKTPEQTPPAAQPSNVVQLPSTPRALAGVAAVGSSAVCVPTITATPKAASSDNVVSLEQRRQSRLAPTLRARYAVPFAVAAGVAFAVSMREAPSKHEPAHTVAAHVSPPAHQANMMALDGILDELVSLHAQPLPPEVTQQDEVRKFDPFVGVPVEPPKLQNFGAKWVGGRVLPIRDSRAAMLQYSLAGGHRVTVYVYDPRRVKPESAKLTPRVVRNNPMLVGNVRGYNIAATERQGVGYAIATDLDEPESVELAAAAH